MSNEETNNETETLAILGGVRPRLFETQFVEVFAILSCDELANVKRKLEKLLEIRFPPREALTLLRSETVIESLSWYDASDENDDFRSALAKIRATVDLMGDGVRLSF